MPCAPESFLKAIAPYREDIAVAVECIFTWHWLADLCSKENIPFVLGHALYMKAIHGGKAKNDKIDAHKIAVLLRGGMLPRAYVYPPEMRATRDLLRRRVYLMLTACGSTTDLVVGRFRAAFRVDRIAVLLLYLYPDLVDRGMRSAPFPNPKSNWTTLSR